MKKIYPHIALLSLSLASWALTGCGGKDFSLAYDSNSFAQSTQSASVPIDVLWVVDNSGSMQSSQDAVATNAAAFIDKFKDTNFDFQIAVTTTAAYRSLPMFTNDPMYSRFRDGTDDTSHTGVFVIKKDTPNIESVFQTNIVQGTRGSGDERSFQSIEGALLNVQNRSEPFPCPGAFLAVIVITDEEDFSWTGTANIQTDANGNPTPHDDARLLPVSYFTDFLDGVTNSTVDRKDYNVNAIAIFDQQCLDVLQAGLQARRIAHRTAALVDATGGVKASLCGDFSSVLSNLTDTILIKSTTFYLDRQPNVQTIEVFVNGTLVPASGWDYNAGENSISFHADTIPPKGSSINVKYLPTTLKD